MSENTQKIEKISFVVRMLSNLDDSFIVTTVKTAINKISEKLACQESLTLDESFLAIMICLRDNFKEFMNKQTLCDLANANLISRYHCDVSSSHVDKDKLHICEVLHKAYNANQKFVAVDSRFSETDTYKEFTEIQANKKHSSNFNIIETRVTAKKVKRLIDFKLDERFFTEVLSSDLVDQIAIIEANMFQ